MRIVVNLKDAERHVLRGVLDLLFLHGFRAFRVNSGKIQTRQGTWVQLAPKGTADVIAIVPRSGRLFAIETKREKGGHASQEQVEFLDAIRGDNGIGIIIDDLKTLERVILELKADPWANFDMEEAP